MGVKTTVPIVLLVALMGSSIDASSPLPDVMSYFSRVQETMWQKAFPEIPVDALVAAKFRPEPSASIFRFNIDEAFEIVSKSPHLIWLDASGRDVTDQHIRSITGYKRLRYLNLADTKVSVDAAIVLLRSLPSLQFFVFSSADEKTAARFNEFRPHMEVRVVTPRERILYLPDGISFDLPFKCALADSVRLRLFGGHALREGDFAFRGLQSVLLTTQFAVSESTLQAFDELANMPGLQIIDAFERPLTRRHLERLAGINTVVYLGLSRTRITADDVPLVNRFPGLIYLHLDDSQATPESIAALRNHPTLKYLIVDVPGKLSEEQLGALKSLANAEVAFRHVLPTELRAYEPRGLGWHPRLGVEDILGCRDFPKTHGAREVAAFSEIERLTIDKALTVNLATDLRPLRHLRWLQFQYVPFQKDDIERLRLFPQLTSLALSSCSFDPMDLRPVMSLPDLKELHLSRNHNGNLATLRHEAISEIAQMRTLETLGLSGMEIAPEAVAAISRAPSLQHIVLSDNALPTEFPEILRGAKRLHGIYLNRLSIAPTTLANLRLIPSLTIVRLNSVHLDHESLTSIASLPHLKELSLFDTNVEEATIAQIKARYPSLELDIRPKPKK